MESRSLVLPADDLVLQLGQAILSDPHYADREWKGISLVIELAQRKRMYGFIYFEGGAWEPEAPDDFDLLDTANVLRETMATGGNRWRRCLVKLVMPGPCLTIEFDYDGMVDWAVVPNDQSALADTLKPNC
jgi:hypothetical protein